MTFEERAKAIVEKCPGLHREDFGDDAVAFITAHIRSACYYAVEEAAQVAERVSFSSNPAAYKSADIAAAIRSLKGE
jgi:hypothetical protein